METLSLLAFTAVVASATSGPDGECSYRENGDRGPCIGGRDIRTGTLQTRLRFSYWNETFCRQMLPVNKCLREKLKRCGKAYVKQALRAFENKYGITGTDMAEVICEGPRASPWLEDVFRKGEKLERVADRAFQEEVTKCLSDFKTEVISYGWLWEKDRTIRDSLRLWAVSTYRCALSALPPSSGHGSRALLTFVVNTSLPADFREAEGSILGNPIKATNVLMKARSTVGAFGDPHLLVYRKEYLQTCSAQDMRLYLSNKFLRITGRSDFVRYASKATTLREVKFEFFDNRGAVFHTFEAAAGNLSLRNEDEASAQAAGGGGRKLSIHPVIPNKKVLLTYNSTGIVVIVQRWWNYFFFTARMADVILDNSFGLLISGCPRNELLEEGLLNPMKRSVSQSVDRCEEACSPVENVGEYNFRRTCVYDCEQTNSTAVATMTRDFVRDYAEIETEHRNIEGSGPSRAYSLLQLTLVMVGAYSLLGS